MNRKQTWMTMLVAAALGLAIPALVRADGGNERTGVNSKDGNPSPTAGSSQPGGISNLDDYTQQEDRVNITGDKDSVVKILRVNQKNLINDYVIRTFPIKNATPCEMRQAFQDAVNAEGGRVEVINDSVKKEQFLWVAAPKFQIPYIEAALKSLDEAWIKDGLDGSVKDYYKAKFRDISKVAALAKVPGAAAVGVPDDNLIVLDPVGNAALVGGEPFRVAAFLKYALDADRPIPQILLEAAVYEVETTNEKQLGLDYIAWKNGPGRNLFDFIFWGSSYHQDAHNMTSIFDPFVAGRAAVVGARSGNARGWYMGANYLLTSAYLDFLEGSGRARVITRGKILIRNAQTGSISATDQVLYIETNPADSTPSVPALPGNPSTGTPASPTPTGGIVPGTFVPAANNIPIYARELDKDNKLNIGFTMTVKPYICQKITELNVNLALNNIIGQTANGTPQVRTDSLLTTVLVKDGQDICVGGLKRTEDVKETQKIPILGSIPVLGWLFGHETTARRETEIIVVLTPRIFLGTEQAMEMASEEDNRIRAQVERRVNLDLPKTEFGFDQWLIGSDTQGPVFSKPVVPPKPAVAPPTAPASPTTPPTTGK